MASTSKGTNFGFRITDELMADLDRLRREEPDLPSRGELIRRLIKRAAEAADAKGAKAKKKPD